MLFIFHGTGLGKAIVWSLIVSQLIPTAANAAPPDEAKPELSPADRVILDLYLKRSPDSLTDGRNAREFLSRLFYSNSGGKPYVGLALEVSKGLSKAPEPLIAHFPQLAEFLDRSRFGQREESEAATRLMKDRGIPTDFVAEARSLLLDEIRMARRDRELKIKEYEASILAREVVRKRTRIDPDDQTRRRLRSRSRN